MTPEAQRIAICRAMKWPHSEDGRWLKWDGGDQRIPIDPLSSLDAMNEAEKVLTDEEWMVYENLIHEITLRDDCGHIVRHLSATAAQRAEAFLKALTLWTP